MINSEDISSYFDKILNFLSYRSRSEYEINFYMLRKNWSEEIRQVIIEKLKQLKLIDDEDFALQWIRSRTYGRAKGKSVLKMELRKKGIDKEIIDRLLSEERQPAEEEILAEKLAVKRLVRLKNLPIIEQKSKLYGLLLRRGFSSDITVRIIDKLLKREYNDIT